MALQKFIIVRTSTYLASVAKEFLTAFPTGYSTQTAIDDTVAREFAPYTTY